MSWNKMEQFNRHFSDFILLEFRKSTLLKLTPQWIMFPSLSTKEIAFQGIFFFQHDAQRKFWRIFTYINKTHNGKSNAFVSRDWLAQCKFKHMGPQLLTSWGPPSRTTSLFECPRFSEVWNTGPVTSFVGREPIGSQSCGLANGEAVNLTYDFVHVVLALKLPAWILGNVENWFF